jgi:hypothetical protein
VRELEGEGRTLQRIAWQRGADDPVLRFIFDEEGQNRG